MDPNVKRRDFEEYMNVMNDTNAGNRGLARMKKKCRIPAAFAGLTHHHNSIALSLLPKEHRIYYKARMVREPLPIIYGTRLVCHKKRTGASNISAGDCQA